MIEIEKNIPIPSKSKYPFARMEIGDSFFISSAHINTISSCRSSFCKTKEGKDKQFSCHTVDDGVRVWRIK